MKAPRRAMALLAAALSTAGLAACGGGSSSDTSSSPAASTPTTAASTTPASSKTVGATVGPNGEKATPISALTLTPAQIDKVKAGNYTSALVWHQSSDFVTAVSNGARDEFAQLGIKVVAETNANFDAGKQKSDIETVLAKKPSVLLSLPVDPTATASAYRDANKAGTKLVLLSNVPTGFVAGKDYVAVVTDDLFQMGKHAADALAQSIGGKGDIAYLFHDAKYYVTNQRDQAFKQTIESNYPNIHIVAEKGIADPAKAEDQANAILIKNPNLAGIYVTFAQPPAEGVLSALRNNTNTTTKLVSLDLDEPLAVDMARGGNTAALVADEAYALGQSMAKAAAYGLLGQKAPPFIVAPAVTVTKANLAQGYMQSLHQQPPKAVLDAMK
ncbi:MAG: LacI family transcriptional regulator [Solirubrobacterales bacterium]|nr:LacI family transcriptional regulator [Solirubrobacterales bacterium]